MALENVIQKRIIRFFFIFSLHLLGVKMSNQKKKFIPKKELLFSQFPNNSVAFSRI